MEKTVRLNADQREDLVAYLDGELPQDQVQQIDQIIARSEVARHEVEVLARTWEMLDILPTAQASADFTSRTMTNLKVIDEPFSIKSQWWYKYLVRAASMLVWIAALGLSSWIGFQITRSWVPNPNEALLQDLPDIENLDQYQEVGDIEFLQQLKQTTLFDDGQEK